jgi:ribose/xylose/arabinose/galactoside ABC-type transport system permease subunit
VFALLVKAGFDPALCILAGLATGTAIGGLVGTLIVVFRLSSLVLS